MDNLHPAIPAIHAERRRANGFLSTATGAILRKLRPRSKLLTEGVAFHRSAIDRADLEYLGATANHAYELVEDARNGIVLPGPHAELTKHIAESTIKWGGIPISQSIDIASEKFPRAAEVFAGISRAAEQLVARESGLLATYRSELSYVRRHTDHQTHVAWHYDAGAAGTGPYDPCFNVWVPFVPVGLDCPTLEFIPGSNSRMKAGDHGNGRVGFPTPAWLEANTGPQIAFRMDPGDILVFDHWTLHRTQPLASPTKVRTSAEIRISATRPLA
jgi:hypothetical protein